MQFVTCDSRSQPKTLVYRTVQNFNPLIRFLKVMAKSEKKEHKKKKESKETAVDNADVPMAVTDIDMDGENVCFSQAIFCMQFDLV